MKDSFIENDYVELWEQDGIIYEKFKHQTDLDYEGSQQIVADRIKISKGRMMPMLVDMCQLIRLDRDARIWLASNEALAYLTASAFVFDNAFGSLFYHLYKSVENPSIPIESFRENTKALAWLEAYKLHH